MRALSASAMQLHPHTTTAPFVPMSLRPHSAVIGCTQYTLQLLDQNKLWGTYKSRMARAEHMQEFREVHVQKPREAAVDNEHKHIPRLETYFSEFFGTFLLTLTVCSCACAGAGVWASPLVVTCIMGLIYMLGPISGAHFNPAVTLAFTLDGAQLNAFDASVYVFAQFLGSMTAAGMAMKLFGCQATHAHFGPGMGFAIWEPLFMELFYTFVLVFVVMSMANMKQIKDRRLSIIVVGVTILATAAAAHVSGACLNPALGIGINTMLGGNIKVGIAYAFAELAGSVLGFVLHGNLRRQSEMQMEHHRSSGMHMWAFKLVGTFFLTLTVCLSCATNDTLAWLNIWCAFGTYQFVQWWDECSNSASAVLNSVAKAEKGQHCTLRQQVAAQVCGGAAASLLSMAMHMGSMAHHDLIRFSALKGVFTGSVISLILSLMHYRKRPQLRTLPLELPLKREEGRINYVALAKA